MDDHVSSELLRHIVKGANRKRDLAAAQIQFCPVVKKIEVHFQEIQIDVEGESITIYSLYKAFCEPGEQVLERVIDYWVTQDFSQLIHLVSWLEQQFLFREVTDNDCI